MFQKTDEKIDKKPDRKSRNVSTVQSELKIPCPGVLKEPTVQSELNAEKRRHSRVEQLCRAEWRTISPCKV